MPEKKREELRAKRAPLAEQLEDNPNQTELAIEIKVIDDQIRRIHPPDSIETPALF